MYLVAVNDHRFACSLLSGCLCTRQIDVHVPEFAVQLHQRGNPCNHVTTVMEYLEAQRGDHGVRGSASRRQCFLVPGLVRFPDLLNDTRA